MNDHNNLDEHYRISEALVPLAMIVVSGIASISLSKYLVMVYRLVAGPNQGGAAMQFFLLVLMFYSLVCFSFIVYGFVRGNLVKAIQVDLQACLKQLLMAAVYSFAMLSAVLVKVRNEPDDDSMIAFVIVWAVWFTLFVVPMTIYASRRRVEVFGKRD